MAGATLFYVDQDDQRWYRTAVDGTSAPTAPTALTPVAPAGSSLRYGDGRLTRVGPVAPLRRGEDGGGHHRPPAGGRGRGRIPVGGSPDRRRRFRDRPPTLTGRPVVGLDDLGPPLHALGQLRDPSRPSRGGRRLGPRPGRSAGRRRSRDIGGPAVVDPGRQPGLRRRPERMVDPPSPGSGAAGRGREGRRPGRRGFRVPRAGLGPRPVDHGRSRRRLPGLPHARRRARPGGPAPPARRRPAVLDHRRRRPALCEHRRSGRHRRR